MIAIQTPACTIQFINVEPFCSIAGIRDLNVSEVTWSTLCVCVCVCVSITEISPEFFEGLILEFP